MRVLVIPDVHLKPWMFNRAEEILKVENIEQVVCLMDIPDDWFQEYNIELYEKTYDAAIAFARNHPEMLWCWGNHDVSYLWGKNETGFSGAAWATILAKTSIFQKTVEDPSRIAFVHRIDDVLFCHGGLSDRFVRDHVISRQYNDIDSVINVINGLSKNDLWNDRSPIWLRPQYGEGKMYKPRKLLQVVGHTPVSHVVQKNNLISCDVFSTYRNGLPIGTQEFLILDTKTWDFFCAKYRELPISNHVKKESKVR